MHVLFSPTAIQALFKTRGPARDGFNLQIAERGLGVDTLEAKKFFGFGESSSESGIPNVQLLEKWNHNYLLERRSVDELTMKFVEVLKAQLASDSKSMEGNSKEKTVNLCDWVQDKMFTASTTALMGSRLLEIYPELRKDFFDFDRHMLTLFFRVPKFLSPVAYNVRARALTGMTKWQKQVQEECSGEIPDPDGDIDWEPLWGSRANRAKQRYYKMLGLRCSSRAGMDLGFMFGLSSNAIPAAGWMLLHVLDPQGDKTLLPRLMSELKTVSRDDGSLDIQALVGLPLLASVFHEVLRLYVDVLVTRELKEELTLPLDHGQQRVFLEKNSVVVAPSWLGHRDEMLWTEPPCNQFYADRFLQKDTESGKIIFSTVGTSGKFFPFGGGKTICPGRVFAKQEVLGSVATILLSFDIKSLGYIDEQGRETTRFPRIRDGYLGSGVMATDSDMKVAISKRGESTG